MRDGSASSSCTFPSVVVVSCPVEESTRLEQLEKERVCALNDWLLGSWATRVDRTGRTETRSLWMTRSCDVGYVELTGGGSTGDSGRAEWRHAFNRQQLRKLAMRKVSGQLAVLLWNIWAVNLYLIWISLVVPPHSPPLGPLRSVFGQLWWVTK